MKSPFKFLDAYTRRDSKHFFGRDEEIEKLYKMVFETPLVLVYGLSGTGKTSLVQCGLASKFDGPDWFPFFIRRNNDINQSLHDEIDNQVIVEIKNIETDELIRQFPPEELLQIREKMIDLTGLLFDQQV